MKKSILSLTAAIIIAFAASGCTSAEKVEQTKTITDLSGKQIDVPVKIERIISAAPSNTEIIAALGLADKIVASDSFSAEVEGVPSSAVKMDFMTPNAEAIMSAEPDIIIASGINLSGTDDPFAAVSQSGVPVVYIPSAQSIDEIYKSIEFLSDLLDKKAQGEKIIADMKKEIEKYSEIGKTIKDKKRVYFEISPAPNLYTFGSQTYLNELLNIVGAENIYGLQNSWLSISAESVIAENPDVILTNVNYIDNPIDEIKKREGFGQINAVKNNQVYLIDANASSRPTHNIVKALKQIAASVYPEKYEKQA